MPKPASLPETVLRNQESILKFSPHQFPETANECCAARVRLEEANFLPHRLGSDYPTISLPRLLTLLVHYMLLMVRFAACLLTCQPV